MSTARRIRVLVVDDSAFARKVVREVLSRAHDVEVVGTARDGIDALEQIERLDPDVVTLDLHMPELDGRGVLTSLAKRPRPRVIVVSTEGDDTEDGLAAMELGAAEIVRKPTATANDKLYHLGTELLETVRALGIVPVPGDSQPPPAPARVSVVPVEPSSRSLVVIGASTGGPSAIQQILQSLPANFPVPIACVLHMPLGYTEAYAERVDRECALEVVEAADNLELIAGRVVIARAGMHLRVDREGTRLVAHLAAAPLDTPHRPAVDVLFASAAEAVGDKLLAAVLTGMGDDGRRGAEAVVAAGGTVITQSAASCVVYGMPRAVVEAGLSSGQFPLSLFASAILERV